MHIVNPNLPKISLNGKELPIKDMCCRKIEITKHVDDIDVVNMELIGHVEIEPINVPKVTIKVYDIQQNKYITFKATDLQFESE